jgi:hypothetical protein
MTQYGVILFHTTSGVMQGEKLLVKAGLALKLIPTPREFSSDCGIAIRFEWQYHQPIKLLLEEKAIEFDAIFPLEQKNQ